MNGVESKAYKLTAKSVKLGMPLQIVSGSLILYQPDRGNPFFPIGSLTKENKFVVLAKLDDLCYYVSSVDWGDVQSFGEVYLKDWESNQELWVVDLA